MDLQHNDRRRPLTRGQDVDHKCGTERERQPKPDANDQHHLEQPREYVAESVLIVASGASKDRQGRSDGQRWDPDQH